MKLSTEGLERPRQVKKESSLPFIFLIGFVLLLSLGGYLYNQGTLREVYLSTKETLIGLNLEEKKEYLGILYSKRDLVEAAKVLQQIISFPQEDTEQNNAFLALLYFNQQDYDKALLIYKKLVKESDSPEQYIFYYASCLFHQGEIDEALKQHYQLFSIDDRYVDNVEGILKIMLKQKKKQEGLSFLEGYLSKYPSAQAYLTPTVVKDSILAIGVTKVYHHGFDN